MCNLYDLKVEGLSKLFDTSLSDLFAGQNLPPTVRRQNIWH